MKSATALLILIASLLLGQLAEANTSNRTTSTKAYASEEANAQSITLRALKKLSTTNETADRCLHLLTQPIVHLVVPEGADPRRVAAERMPSAGTYLAGVRDSKIIKAAAATMGIRRDGTPWDANAAAFLAASARQAAACADALSTLTRELSSELRSVRPNFDRAVSMAATLIQKRLDAEFATHMAELESSAVAIAVSPGNAGYVTDHPAKAAGDPCGGLGSGGGGFSTSCSLMAPTQGAELVREFAVGGIYAWSTRPFKSSAGVSYLFAYDGTTVKVLKDGVSWWTDDLVGGARITIGLSADKGSDTRRQVER